MRRYHERTGIVALWREDRRYTSVRGQKKRMHATPMSVGFSYDSQKVPPYSINGKVLQIHPTLPCNITDVYIQRQHKTY